MRADSQPRRVALAVLVAVEGGAASDRALDAALRRQALETRDRRLATELVYGVLRRQRSLDASVAPFVRRGWQQLEPVGRCALRLGVYQCAALDRVPDHAAVDATVAAAKSQRPAVAGLVNGVLRAWLRAGAELRATDDLAGRYELPDWWAERWGARGVPEAWLAASLEPLAPVARARPRVLGEAPLADELRRQGVEVEAARWAAGALRIVDGRPLATEVFRRGAFELRGEASLLVPRLLGARPGETVLDACAGRGGKALQIAEEVAGVRLLAADRALWRARECRDAARRALVPEVQAIVADLTSPVPLRAGFDRVLVDAPCSGLGTVRSRPEIKWRVDPPRLERLGALQRRILGHAAAALSPGGTLLYVTCSTEPDENEAVVEAVLAENDWLQRRPVQLPEGLDASLVGDDGYFRTWPAAADLEGFFAARLIRRPQ